MRHRTGTAKRCAAIGVVVAVLLGGCAGPASPSDSDSRSAAASTSPSRSFTVSTSTAPETSGPASANPSPGPQLSGASGTGAANGVLGAWRGTAIEIGGTWVDTYEAQTALWAIAPGGQWAKWRKDLDIAVGAIYRSRGESWKAAAAGRYDARWRTSLTRMKALWGNRPGTLHIRFAHEFNGFWTPWYVTGKDTGDFVTAWRRYRALQKQILPNAKLVFNPNDQTAGRLKLDWRMAFPGADYVDEMGVNSYNQYPYLTTQEKFDWKINRLDKRGAPLGIERHREFAESVGLPLAIPEWSSNSRLGDGAEYVAFFAEWLRAHAGTGPGQIPYEILFHETAYDHGKYAMYPKTKMPKAAAAYVKEF